MPVSTREALVDYFQRAGYRMLVAHLTEPMRLLTHDSNVARYGGHHRFCLMQNDAETDIKESP